MSWGTIAQEMNWMIFSVTALAGIIAGILFRRWPLTQAEAWSIIVTRVAYAGIIGFYLPEQLTPAAVILLAGSEIARVVEFAAAFVADKIAGKMEARYLLWQLRPRRRGIEPETAQSQQDTVSER